MFGGIDPKKMQSIMKQMGIKQEEMSAERVIIESAEKKLIIEPAQVQKITMQGQETWQITGKAREESSENNKEADITLIMEKTSASREEAEKALEESKGDIAEAIIHLENK